MNAPYSHSKLPTVNPSDNTLFERIICKCGLEHTRLSLKGLMAENMLNGGISRDALEKFFVRKGWKETWSSSLRSAHYVKGRFSVKFDVGMRPEFDKLIIYNGGGMVFYGKVPNEAFLEYLLVVVAE